MTRCFYHSGDNDGMCSAAIVRRAIPDAALHGINYGEDFPWAQTMRDDHIIMVDFSLQPWSEMERLARECDNVTWIDHHKSAIDDFNAGDGPIFRCWCIEIGKAACEIAWEFFFPKEPMPRSVFHIGRHDVWDHSNPDTIKYHYGLMMQDTRPDNDAFWQAAYQDYGTTRIILHGGMYQQYDASKARAFCAAYAFDVEFDGLRCIAANVGMCNSMIFESIYDPSKHDAMMSFAWRNGKWTVSLYSDKPDIDVSATAKARGGGGHKGADGFQCDVLPFLAIVRE